MKEKYRGKINTKYNTLSQAFFEKFHTNSNGVLCGLSVQRVTTTRTTLLSDDRRKYTPAGSLDTSITAAVCAAPEAITSRP